MEENKNFEETIEKVEKKTLKEVIAENKGKILAGVSCAIVGVGGYLIYKYHVKINLQDLQIKENADNIEFVRDVVKEGALAEAIAAINRKITYRLEKIENLNHCKEDIGPELISKYKEELKELIKKQEAFMAEYDSIAIK